MTNVCLAIGQMNNPFPRLLAILAALLVTCSAWAGTTTTSLVATPSPAQAGSAVSLTATVSGTNPTGNVKFFYNGNELGVVAISAGRATYPGFTPQIAGWFGMSAQYLGDSLNQGSTSPVVGLTVNPGSSPSSTTLSTSANPIATTDRATVTAYVGGNAPQGTVAIKVNGSEVGWPSVSGGKVTFQLQQLTAGTYSVVAEYRGDAVNAASASTPLALQVGSNLPALPAFVAPTRAQEFDANGNITRVTQAPGVAGFGFQTQTTYDTNQRLKGIVDAKNGQIQFAYNGRDDVVRVTDPRSLVTQYNRNGLGDEASLVSPDTGTTNKTYDAAGNLVTLTDSRGVLATHRYDALNRLTGLTYSKTGMTTQSFGFTYDQIGGSFTNGVGRLTTATHPAGTRWLSYDPEGRIVGDTHSVNAATGANAAAINRIVSYAYDAAGNITSITYPSGRRVAYTYSNGRLVSVALAKDATTAATPLLTQIEWEPFGGVRSWQWQMASSSLLHYRTFDTSGRLVRYRLGDVMRDLAYDAADRIASYKHYAVSTGLAQTAQNQTFTYDELGRVTSVAYGTSSWNIAYDANGNRTSVTQNGVARAYTTATTSNRLTALSNPVLSYSYDAAGNTTAGPFTSATYDASGRMRTAIKNAITTTYDYDYFGRRVRKYSSSGAASTVIFAYDQDGRILGEYNSTGVAIREYVWLGSTPVALFTPDPVSSTNPPIAYFVHADHLDTPRVVVDRSGNSRWSWFAEPFGTTAPQQNPAGLGVFSMPLRFPGQYADTETGLNYNYFRDFDPSIGRYTQSDPIGLAGGINTYAYVGANPLSYVDPVGLDRWGGRVGAPSFMIAGGGVLNLYGASGQSIATYPYTSGTGGVTDPRVPDRGPIPPGTYSLEPSQISPAGFFRKFIDPRDWGDFRVPLKPSSDTNTFGRTGFMMHGGVRPGSTGCIDIGSADKDLFPRLQQVGGPLPVFVSKP